MKKKKIIIMLIGITLILSIALIETKFALLKKDNAIDDEKTIEMVTPLTKEDASVAADQTVKNIVKIINKIDKDKIIYGTGFFDKSGYLVTNSHVVDIEGDISIKYNNNQEVKAKLYSNDLLSDLAILKVDEPKVKALPLGTTINLKVTDELYSVGYQLNLEGAASVTKGILSSKRSASGIEFLQTDAAVNYGGSGGPVINSKGEVMGIVTLASENATLSFAISSDTLSLYINKLISNPSVNYIVEKRKTNALNIVLKEVNYTKEDIYDDYKYFENASPNNNQSDNKENQNNNTTNSESKPVVKSGDNNLKSLTIQNYKINFKPNETYYGIVAKNNETSLNIIATANHSKAKVSITGNNNLKVGRNEIIITVTAENGRQKKYEIIVSIPQTRLEGLTKISVGYNTFYSQEHNGNVILIFWDYRDRDNIDLHGAYELDILSKIYIDLYAGTGDNLRLLKTYTYNANHNQSNVIISTIDEIRSMLAEEDYTEENNTRATLTYKVRVETKEQGTFSGQSNITINK